MPRFPFTGPVTDEFGYRVHPISGQIALHTGMDGVGFGNLAPENGVLESYGYAGGYGWLAQFRGQSGWGHRFGHNRDANPLIPLFTWTPEGQQVAVMGSTGNSTGDHCHWETLHPFTGEQIDPRIWFAQATAAATAGDTPTPIKEDELSAEDVAKLTTVIQRENRSRVFVCTDHTDRNECPFIVINPDLPTGDPAKIGYSTSVGQLAKLALGYQGVGDKPDQAKKLSHGDIVTLLNLAKGTDPIYTPKGLFAEQVGA